MCPRHHPIPIFPFRVSTTTTIIYHLVNLSSSLMREVGVILLLSNLTNALTTGLKSEGRHCVYVKKAANAAATDAGLNVWKLAFSVYVLLHYFQGCFFFSMLLSFYFIFF